MATIEVDAAGLTDEKEVGDAAAAVDVGMTSAVETPTEGSKSRDDANVVRAETVEDVT